MSQCNLFLFLIQQQMVWGLRSPSRVHSEVCVGMEDESLLNAHLILVFFVTGIFVLAFVIF